MVRLDNGQSVEEVLNRNKKKKKSNNTTNPADAKLRTAAKAEKVKQAEAAKKKANPKNQVQKETDYIKSFVESKKTTPTTPTTTTSPTTTTVNPTNPDGGDIVINIPDFDFSGFQSYFDRLFENDYNQPPAFEAPEFIPTLKQVEQLVPWLSKSGNLLQIYQDTWAETGDSNFALAAVRDSEDYDNLFPGNKRGDGSVRHSESEYKAIESGYKNVILENGINPKLFENKFGGLISGAISVAELSQRVGLVRRAIDENPDSDAVLQFYSSNYGIEMTKEGLLAASIDPGMSEEIFARKITMAEIGAEAITAGATISFDTVSELASAGYTEEQADTLFSQAVETEKTLSSLAASQGRADLTQEEVVRAEALNDGETSKEIARILQQSASQSSLNIGARKAQGGAVSGLTEG